MGDREFLAWIRDRLVHVYGESPNVDFIRRLDQIISAHEPPLQPGVRVEVFTPKPHRIVAASYAIYGDEFRNADFFDYVVERLACDLKVKLRGEGYL
jgi:hypothetical protein